MKDSTAFFLFTIIFILALFEIYAPPIRPMWTALGWSFIGADAVLIVIHFRLR